MTGEYNLDARPVLSRINDPATKHWRARGHIITTLPSNYHEGNIRENLGFYQKNKYNVFTERAQVTLSAELKTVLAVLF